jgi:predicted molibdopterin-dependent oxidoreductase YjgC
VRNDKIIGVSPNFEGPVNGHLCVKGRFGWDFVDSPDRLKTPLIKKDGQFVEASWEEALTLVSEKFKEVRAQYGADALAGLSSARCTNEENYLFQKLFRMLGTNNVDHCARL